MINANTLTSRYPVIYLNFFDGEWVVLASSGVLDPIQQLSTGSTLESAIENASKDTKCQIHQKHALGLVDRVIARLDKWLAASNSTSHLGITPDVANALKRQMRQDKILKRMMKPKKGATRAKNPSSRIF